MRLVPTTSLRWILSYVVLAGCGAASFDGASTARAVQSIVGVPATAISVDVSVNQIGRSTTQGNGVFRTFHEYDARGRSLKTQHVIGDTSYLYTTTYGNPGGDAAAGGPVVVGSTFPDGEQVSFRYDAAWAMQAIQTQGCTAYDTGNHCTAHEAAQLIIQSISRNARGQTLSVVYGDGTTSTHAYNDQTDLRLHRLQTAVTATPAVLRQFHEYSYDTNGNITAVTDYCNEASTAGCSASTPDSTFTASYSYDSINQLTGGTWTYGYDDFGNLINKEGKSQCYGTSCGVTGARGPHALARDGANRSYQYDANGNLIARSDGLTVTWNAANMPVAMTGGPLGTATTQKYFLESSLWKKVQGGTTTYYLPDMRVENGAAIKFFTGFAERSTDGTLKFYHDDHLGSSTLVTDQSGSVVHRQAYTPYGEDRIGSPSGSFTVAAGLRYQFNFKEREQDGTGYYDYGARMYDPGSGRWLSPDNLAEDGLNRYSYVRNNPVRHTDPTGNQSEDSVAVRQGERHGGACMQNQTFVCDHNGCGPRATGRSATVPQHVAQRQQAPVLTPEEREALSKFLHFWPHEAHEQLNDPESVAMYTAEIQGHILKEWAKHLGEQQHESARLIGALKEKPFGKSFAVLDEGAVRTSAWRSMRLGRNLGPAVSMGVMTIDGVRVIDATVSGNPDDPAFNDAAGHGGGVLVGIGGGAAGGLLCGPGAPACVVIGGLIGAFAGETGGRVLQHSLTAPHVEPKRPAGVCHYGIPKTSNGCNR